MDPSSFPENDYRMPDYFEVTNISINPSPVGNAYHCNGIRKRIIRGVRRVRINLRSELFEAIKTLTSLSARFISRKRSVLIWNPAPLCGLAAYILCCVGAGSNLEIFGRALTRLAGNDARSHFNKSNWSVESFREKRPCRGRERRA